MKRIGLVFILSALLAVTGCTAPAPASSSSAPSSLASSSVSSSQPDAEVVAEYAMYDGTFVSIEKAADGKSGQLMLENAVTGQFLFNFDDKTVFGIDAATLQPGDPVNVRHSMATTASLPPQSYAFEVQAGGETVAADEPLYVADAALYRGVLEDFAMDANGKTVWVLRQAVGTDYGHEYVQVALDENTRYSFDSTQVGNGAYLEVFYGGEPDANKTVTAIAVNDLGPAESVNFNGVVKEITSDGGKGSILLDPLDANSMAFQFHFTEETKFRIDFAEIQPGVKLNVYHSAAATRSIPPQSQAFEISLMAE